MRSFTVRILISFIILTIACNDRSPAKSPATSNQDSILNGMTKAKEGGQKVEGKFIRIQRLTDRTYALSIQINSDSIAVFETFMPLDENEIQLLKKDANNIRLTYKEYRRPTTNEVIRIVQYMEPIYETHKE